MKYWHPMYSIVWRGRLAESPRAPGQHFVFVDVVVVDADASPRFRLLFALIQPIFHPPFQLTHVFDGMERKEWPIV